MKTPTISYVATTSKLWPFFVSNSLATYYFKRIYK